MKRFFEKQGMNDAATGQQIVKNHSPLRGLTAAALIALMFLQGLAPAAFAQSPVALKNFGGTIDFSGAGPVRPFALDGTASHLGKFTCYGEAVFRPGEIEGSLVGEGVAVFEAANGDLLVGVAIWHISADGTLTGQFPWRDSVQLSDGTIVSTTGRFVTDRPPGALIAAEFIFVATILVMNLFR